MGVSIKSGCIFAEIVINLNLDDQSAPKELCANELCVK